MSVRLERGYLVAVAIVAPWLLSPATGRAADVEITSTSAAQSYDVASPWGYAIERRRLLQTLGFSLYHLQGDYEPGKADYNLRLMGRVDADFGLGNHLPGNSSAETNYEALGGSRFVPGLTLARFDLMYAYIEGRNLADGLLSFKAGRQYVTDVLGWWSFDGGLARVSTPFFVDLEVYGGLEQRGGLPLSTSRYESQGVWRGGRGGFDEPGGPKSSDYPSYQFAGEAPAFGAAIESNGPNWVHGRLSYRRVYNTGEAFMGQFPQPTGYATLDGLRLSSERIGYAANINKTDLGGLKGGFAYDFYNQVIATAFGGLEVYATERATVGLDADHYRPTFDADSIFNWFSHNPTSTFTARTAVRITRDFDVSASGGTRLWATEGDPDALTAKQCEAEGQAADCKAQGLEFAAREGDRLTAATRDEANREEVFSADGLGQLNVRWLTTLGGADARGMLQIGERGHRAGGDLGGTRKLDGGRYDLGARVSLYDYTDFRAASAHTTTFGYMLGAAVRPLDLTRLGVEWEHNTSDRVGQRFRLLARLDLAWVR